MDEPHNGTEKILRDRRGSNPNSRKNLRPFGKGADPRRNLNGRPHAFDYARTLAQAIASEELELKDGRKINVAEAVLRSWVKSPEPSLQRAFIEYAFGKVPDKIEATGLENKTTLVLHFDHENGITQR